jgi:hypothetical protein
MRCWLMVCQQVAQILGQLLERISVERVFRSFYHYGCAVQPGECDDLAAFLAEQAQRPPCGNYPIPVDVELVRHMATFFHRKQGKSRD